MNGEDINHLFEVDLHDATEEERFFFAVMCGAYNYILEALNRGVPVDLPRFNHGGTALLFAKTEQIARLLLERGADPNAKDWEGANPLCNAIGLADYGFVRLLLDYGADPLLISPRGTPLDAAREYGTAEILEMIQNAAST